MVLKAEKERIKTLISDTVTLLCKNGLNYKAQFSIEAVIGISLDESEEFYLSIKENVKQAQVVEKPNREPAEQSARRSPNRSPVLTPTKKRKHGLLANIKKEVHIKSTPPANFSNSRQANGSHVDQSTSDVIPNLSLGDIQENASEYWSSMTPGGGNDDNQEGGQEESVSVEGSQPPAKRQNRDSSNTSGDANQTDLQQQGDDDSMSHQADVISIKDEPDSDYDESDLQLQEHGGQLSLEGSTLQPVSTPSWMAGLPHSALQTSQGDPQQAFPARFPAWTGVFPDGHTEGVPNPEWALSSDYARDPPPGVSYPFPSLPGMCTQQPQDVSGSRGRSDLLAIESRIARRILNSKGSVVASRRIQMGFRGLVKTANILKVMKDLDLQGLGCFVGEHDRRKFFKKQDPNHVNPESLAMYNISHDPYSRAYYEAPRPGPGARTLDDSLGLLGSALTPRHNNPTFNHSYT